MASSSNNKGFYLPSAASSTWNNAVSSVANIFMPMGSNTPPAGSTYAPAIYDQLLNAARSYSAFEQAIIWMSPTQQGRLAADINLSGFQYHLIETFPNLRIAQLLHSIGVRYDDPHVYVKVLQHPVLRNVYLQEPARQYGWTNPKAAEAAIFNNQRGLDLISSWLRWLVYVVRVDPFSLSIPVETENQSLYLGAVNDVTWKTPAFAATVPESHATVIDTFRPAFVWFVRHAGNFLAYKVASGEVFNALDGYLHPLKMVPLEDIAPSAVALFALCPEKLSMNLLPRSIISANDLQTCISTIIQHGGAATAISQVPKGPGPNRSKYGNVALQMGNRLFIEECQSIFKSPLKYDNTILPFVRVDLIPWFIANVPYDQLEAMLQSIPWQYASEFRKYFGNEIAGRKPTRLYMK